MKLASGTAPVPQVPHGGRDGGTRHRRRGEQQRPRHVRGDAPGRVPAQAGHARPARDARARRRSTWRPSAGRRRSGWTRQIGSLEAGKRADLIVVSMNGARQTPMYDPVSHLVYVTRGDDVRTTIVNGQVLMRDRQVRTLDERDRPRRGAGAGGKGQGGGRRLRVEHADVRQVAVAFGVIEAVAHHEAVLDREARCTPPSRRPSAATAC